jgi:Calcineurin-like phosphoesterase superfamily domain
MVTAVVSDLHLGALEDSDVARVPARRERLLEELSGVDRVVLLGDVLELRQRPVAELLHLAKPFFEDLGRTAAGRRVLIVPGNHDHALAEPWLTRLRVEGRPLGAEGEWPVEPGDGAAGRIAEWMPKAEVTLAYPGVRLRPDVYATHGHYLDLHMTVPRLEAIGASAMGRITGRGPACETAADYEAVVAPMYGFMAGLAEGASPALLGRGGQASRSLWRRVNGHDGLGRLLLGRVTIQGAVAVLNRAGLGPFRTELTGEGLRRSGLQAMGHVAERLVPGVEHVLFGHTHRPGPLPDDDLAEWSTPSGIRLWNCGNWFRDPAFVRPADTDNPYLPGTVLLLDDTGPPRLRNVLLATEPD